MVYVNKSRPNAVVKHTYGGVDTVVRCQCGQDVLQRLVIRFQAVIISSQRGSRNWLEGLVQLRDDL